MYGLALIEFRLKSASAEIFLSFLAISLQTI